MRQPTDVRRPEILVVCTSEVILCGVSGLLTAAGYVVRAFPDPWRARKLLASHRFDLAIVAPTDSATQELLVHLGRSAPAVKLLELDGLSRFRRVEGPVRGELTTSLLGAVADLVGVPSPTDGSPTAA